jgi:hypothetical protein
LIGFAIFAAYIIAAKIAMAHAGIVPDPGGWHEVIEKMLHGWKQRLVALMIPLQLLAYALPVSVVLPFAIVLVRRMPVQDVRRVRAIAVLGTLAATAVIWMIEGNDNPRYEYVLLPLLAPLVGFVWANWERREVGFNQVLLGVCILMCGAGALVAVKVPSVGIDRILIVTGIGVSAVLVVGICVLFATKKERAAKAASPVVVGLL